MTTFFHIICRSRINGKTVDHVHPQTVGDYTTRRDVVNGIANDDITDAFQIWEVIPDEQIVNEITADIASDLREHYAIQGEGVPDHAVDFIEAHTVGFVARAA